MYNRSKKDNYRKKIEELIGGRQKRSRKDTSSSKTNADNDDITINDNSSMSNVNEDDVNMLSDDISENDNIKNIHVQKWSPSSKNIEGIRKYLETNKIKIFYNLNFYNL